MEKLYPNEKREDYIEKDYYVYGMQCLNCGEVAQYVVHKGSLEYSDFRDAKLAFHTEEEFEYCEHCGLITRQRLLTMSPPPEECD